jgi:maltose O-acetyltransferase
VNRHLEVLRGELNGFIPRLLLIGFLLRGLPAGCAGRLRTLIYRGQGVTVGRSTLIMGTITFDSPAGAAKNLLIGASCFINSHVFIDTGDQVTIGDRVAIGHHVLIITTDHSIGSREHRAGGLKRLPVHIGEGAWIGAGSTILPGVTVGPGSVVAAGAVVINDVPQNTLVGGIPARFIRDLS